MSKFWEGLTEGLGERWSAQELGSAFLFWFVGALAWAWHKTGFWQAGWARLTAQVQGIQDPAVYIVLALSGLLLLTVSSVVARWLQLPVLRLAEGYWPWPLRKARFKVAAWVGKRLAKREERWQELDEVAPERRTAEKQAEDARLDAALARYPVDGRRLMPTPLGNILRAAEEHPQVRYGLVTGVCWPRLWLVLPEGAQKALGEARHELNGAARLLFWSIVSLLWTVWAWWAVLVALALAAVAYWGMLQAAGAYGDLLRSAFDLHRFKLNEELRLPLPTTADHEEACGQQLSEYLFRGTVRDLVFAAPRRSRCPGPLPPPEA